MRLLCEVPELIEEGDDAPRDSFRYISLAALRGGGGAVITDGENLP
jgi:hypothetical protein